MSDPDQDQRFSLKRWSTRKLEAARGAGGDAPAVAPPTQAVAPMPDARHAAMPQHVSAAGEQPDPPTALPTLDSLTFESDFSAFLKPDVGELIKRQALRKLFADPHFNVMDGLDVYIDDYSIASPLEPELVKELLHARLTLDPPKTRINAEGRVEDVPPETVQEVEAPGAGVVAGPATGVAGHPPDPGDVPEADAGNAESTAARALASTVGKS
ncbi:MAG: DUF3306 domain-containing protein [Casimicrobiaceae bacterium]